MTNQPYDSTDDTHRHINRVAELLYLAEQELFDRAMRHDASKLKEPEKSGFDRLGAIKLSGLPYSITDPDTGKQVPNPAYTDQIDREKDTIAHHYAHNDHHPEHWPDGLRSMSLFAKLEMLCDWRAAGERHGSGTIYDSIEANQVRFGYDDLEKASLTATAKELGW